MKVFKYKHNDPLWYDNYNGFYFINTHPRKNDPLQLVPSSKANACREFFTMGMQSLVRANNEPGTAKAYALITSGHSKNNVASGATWRDKVKLGVVILNAFEKHYGIPLTKIYPVTGHNWSVAVFAVGSKRWTNSRYSFGLWTLFFRLTSSAPFQTASFKKMAPGMKWPELADRIVNSGSGNSTMVQARKVVPKVDAFFEFEKKHLKDRFVNWDPDHIRSGMQRPEGIVKLVSGNSYSPGFKTEWEAFYRDWKENQKEKAL